MNIKRLLFLAVAVISLTVSCKSLKDNDLGLPIIRISEKSVEAPIAGARMTELTLLSTRPWTATPGADWIAVDPAYGDASGKEQKITVTVLGNSFDGSVDRTAGIVFENAFTNVTMQISQKGHIKADDLLLYFNNFDKEQATKTYGSSKNSWPMLDQSDCWVNAKGSGSEGVAYSYKAVSVRANSSSVGSYSDYAGSGVNNLFFGSSSYLQVAGIGLGGNVNLKLSFGSEKYENSTSTNLFTNSEFPVFISNDGKKWVTYVDYFFKGTAGGRWNVAEGNITVPSGTEKLYLAFQPAIKSAYRLDDLRLEVASSAGTLIDFETGVEMDFGNGTTPPGPGPDPSDVKDVTLAEFVAAPVSDTDVYRFTAKITSLLEKYNSFYVSDGTNEVEVYNCTNYSSYPLEVGGTVTVRGNRSYYEKNNIIEMTNGVIEKYEAGSDTPSGAQYTKATEMKDGVYLIANDGVAATGVSGNEYGYLYTVKAVDKEGVITLNSKFAEFTFTKQASGNYTIKQFDGKYLYCVDAYNSFQVGTQADEWSVSISGGSFIITNIPKNKTIQYSSQYGSYGAYPDVQGSYPVLYLKTGDGPDPGPGPDVNPNPQGSVTGTYSYTFAKGDLEIGTKKLGSINWTLAMQGSTYFGFDSGTTQRGLQMGSSGSPATAIVMGTADYADNVGSIVINTSGASSIVAEVNVKVGDIDCGTYSLTKSAAEYTFTPSSPAKGTIKVTWENSSAKAIYIKSITINPAK